MLLLFYRGTSLVSRVIKGFTWSKYSHVSIVPSDGFHLELNKAKYMAECRLFEAWHKGEPSGVVRRRGIHDAHKKGTRIDVFGVEATVKIAAVLAFLESQVGKRYDFRGVLGFVSRRDGAQAQDKWFCSELAFAAVQAGGVDLLRDIEPHRVSPGLLSKSPLLKQVGTISTKSSMWISSATMGAARR
jgi:hypothetical protein